MSLVKMRSCWSRVDPWSNMNGIHIRRGRFGHTHRPRGSMVLRSRDRGRRDAATSPGRPRGCYRREAKKHSSLEPLEGSHSCQYFDFELQPLETEAIHFCGRNSIFKWRFVVICYGSPSKQIPPVMIQMPTLFPASLPPPRAPIYSTISGQSQWAAKEDALPNSPTTKG